MFYLAVAILMMESKVEWVKMYHNLCRSLLDLFVYSENSILYRNTSTDR